RSVADEPEIAGLPSEVYERSNLNLRILYETFQPSSRGNRSLKHQHAVVVGGSFAGFTAARVLLDHFHQVTVIERDEFPDAFTPRKGVPQSPHVHGILKLGRDLLEELLPGFIADTERNGAVLFDQIATGAMYSPH